MGESEPREHRGLHTKESISEGWLRHTCIIQRLFFPITFKTLEEEYKAKSDSRVSHSDFKVRDILVLLPSTVSST